ncbi:TetR/AcrR family transcriptional regulator [Oceanobacillus halotolerans]|uniref:TetR/AcrR family transcriptional regulator n=1 Tax=Oceanobacillus halotolerans TaxID=2663380 RepID=UPI0013DA0794|nr:TetR-like C-terminal domain-containing protein [Oceanobacillus halotolerans]
MLTNSNRQFKKKQLTRKLLKDAFIDLILENNDVNSITISEITDRADFNRGTFYIHYLDKIDLLEDLYQDAIEGIHECIMKPYRNTDKVVFNGAIPSIKLIFEHIEEHKRLYKSLDLIENNTDIYHRLEQFLWNLFTKEIEIERETDALETDYEVFLSFQIHATVGVIKYWIKKNFIFPTNYMSEQLTSFYSDKVIAMNFKNQKSNEP